MASDPPIEVTIFAADWNNDGTVDDDLRDDLMGGGFRLSYGNDASRVLFPPRVGTLTFSLLNTSNKYFPQGGGSPGSDVKPGRVIHVQTRPYQSGDLIYIFRGRIDQIEPVMDRNRTKTIKIRVSDFLADLSGKRVTIPVMQSKDTGTLIGEILDAVGWPGGKRAIDTGKTRVPFYWANNRDAFTLVSELVAAEGPPASFYYDPGNDEIVFHNRHHRALNEATPQAVYQDADIEDTGKAAYHRFGYDVGWSRIVNDLILESVEYTRAPLGVVGVGPDRIYKVDSTGTSHPTSVTIKIVLDEPADTIVTPVVDRDFVVVSGSPVTPSVNQTSALTVEVTFAATLGVSIITGELTTPQTIGTVTPPDDTIDKLDTVQITPGTGPITPTGANILKGKSYRGINIRGRTITAVSRQNITGSSTASIDQYGKRSFPVVVPWLSQREAEGYAAGVIDLYKDPVEVYAPEFRHGVGSLSAAVGTIIGAEIDERVTFNSTEAGLATPTHIETVETTIAEAGLIKNTNVTLQETNTTGTGTHLVLNSTSDGILGTNTLAF